LAVELNERKKLILKAVIEEHIRTGEPVGSKFISFDKQISLSSATIRNEMAELTEMGYLMQPHTSAGRIPSEQGYRFYVDTLMNSYSHTSAEITSLKSMLAEKSRELDNIIECAGRLASSLTNYPAIAIKAPVPTLSVKRFNIISVDERTFILVMLISENNVKSKSVKVDFDISEAFLKRIEDILNNNLYGVDLEKLTLAQIKKIESQFGEYKDLASTIISGIYDALEEDNSREIRVEGVNKLLEYPEFSNLNKIKSVLSFFDKKEDILDLVKQSDRDDVNIFIGSENSAEGMNDSTVIFKLINVDGRAVGAIGIVGPCRMDYSKVISTVELLSSQISGMYRKEAPLSLPESTPAHDITKDPNAPPGTDRNFK